MDARKLRIPTILALTALGLGGGVLGGGGVAFAQCPPGGAPPYCPAPPPTTTNEGSSNPDQPTTVTVPSKNLIGPTSAKCVSRRHFTIRIRQYRRYHYRSATVSLSGKRLAVRYGRRITAPIDLRGYPRGRFTLVIRVRTTRNVVLKGKRIYHTCVPKRPHTPLPL